MTTKVCQSMCAHMTLCHSPLGHAYTTKNLRFYKGSYYWIPWKKFGKPWIQFLAYKEDHFFKENNAKIFYSKITMQTVLRKLK